MRILSLKVEDELLDALRNVCAQTGKKQSAVIRDALRYYIDAQSNTRVIPQQAKGNTVVLPGQAERLAKARAIHSRVLLDPKALTEVVDIETGQSAPAQQARSVDGVEYVPLVGDQA